MESHQPQARACATCSRAKVKCVFISKENQKCQRCNRLQRSCEPAIVRVRNKRKLSHDNRNRVEQLEAKLDGLVTLLAQQQQNGIKYTNGSRSVSSDSISEGFGPNGAMNIGPSPPQQVNGEAFERNGAINSQSFQLQQTSSSDFGRRSVTVNGLPPQQSTPSDFRGSGSSTGHQLQQQITDSEFGQNNNLNGILTIIPDFREMDSQQSGISSQLPHRPPKATALPSLDPKIYLTPEPGDGIPYAITGCEDPDELLTVFRTSMNHWLPFLSLADNVTAQELHHDRPFLYLSIMGVASRYTQRQAELRKRIMQQLAEKMFVGTERTLDLLQGVLVYTGWSLGHFYNVAWYTNMMSTSSTIVGDLRINKPPFVETPNSIIQLFRTSCSGYQIGCVPPSSSRTLEERRAYLGHFLLNSVIYLLFQRLEAPRWTSYAEECCQQLLDNGIPSDRYAVALIRLQLVQEKVPLSLWHSSPGPVGAFPPPVSFTQSLDTQVQDLKRSLDLEITSKANFQLSYYNVQTAIYRIGLSMSPVGSTFDELGPHRVTLLYSCLQAVKSFVNVFFAIPVSDYQGLPMTFYAQITHTMGTLHLLSTFNHPDWNLSSVNDILSFQEVFRQMALRFTQAKFALGFDPHTHERLDPFSKYAGKFEFMITRWGEKFSPCNPTPSEPSGEEADGQDLRGTNGDGDNLDVNHMDYIDADWIRDMFGAWDYQANREGGTGAGAF